MYARREWFQVCSVPFGVDPEGEPMPKVIWDDCVALRPTKSLAKDEQRKRPEELVFVRQIATDTIVYVDVVLL